MIGKTNVHNVLLNGAPYKALIDTGSQVSILNESLYKQYFNYLPLIDLKDILNVKQVNGEQLKYLGAVELYVTLGKNLSGSNAGNHVLFLVIQDDVNFTLTHGGHFCLVGMNALESAW